MSSAIAQNLQHVLALTGKNVSLVAVSKTKPNDMLMEAYAAGQRHFGENYVQELAGKYKALPKDICWHMIGHLQSNKVKYIAPFVHLIHGVDSPGLLKEINKQGQKNNRIINCLLQVHVAQEETKFGFDANEINTLLQSPELATYNHVCIQGLMTMGSNTDNMDQVKAEFLQVKQLFDGMQELNLPNVDPQILSMGMSGDFELAMACGSNMVRVGSLIFGERNYSKPL